MSTSYSLKNILFSYSTKSLVYCYLPPVLWSSWEMDVCTSFVLFQLSYHSWLGLVHEPLKECFLVMVSWVLLCSVPLFRFKRCCSENACLLGKVYHLVCIKTSCFFSCEPARGGREEGGERKHRADLNEPSCFCCCRGWDAHALQLPQGVCLYGRQLGFCILSLKLLAPFVSSICFLPQ